MRPVNKFKIPLIIAVVLSCVISLWAISCIDVLMSQIAQEVRAGTSTQDDLAKLISFAQNIDASSDVGKGIVSTATARKAAGDGTKRTAQIIRNFPGSANDVFKSLEPLKDAKGFDRFIADIGADDSLKAQGSLAELDYATNVLNPKNVAEMQVQNIPGTQPDLRDLTNNLYEIKSNTFTGTETDFFVRNLVFGPMHDQAAAGVAALAPGANFTLAFQTKLPAATEAIFRDVFQDLLANPRFVWTNGF